MFTRTILAGKPTFDGREKHYLDAPYPRLIDPIIAKPGELVLEHERLSSTPYGLVRGRILRIVDGRETVMFDVTHLA